MIQFDMVPATDFTKILLIHLPTKQFLLHFLIRPSKVILVNLQPTINQGNLFSRIKHLDYTYGTMQKPHARPARLVVVNNAFFHHPCQNVKLAQLWDFRISSFTLYFDRILFRNFKKMAK